MLTQQLKSRIEAGTYRLEPELIAEAMLQRPGVRELLAPAPEPRVTRTGRSHGSVLARRQAA